MDLRNRHDMEEIGWMDDRELAASWQRIDTVKIGRINPISLAPDVLDLGQADDQDRCRHNPDRNCDVSI